MIRGGQAYIEEGKVKLAVVGSQPRQASEAGLAVAGYSNVSTCIVHLDRGAGSQSFHGQSVTKSHDALADWSRRLFQPAEAVRNADHCFGKATTME